MEKIQYTNKKLNLLEKTIIKSFEAINTDNNDPKYYYETIWDLLNQKSNIKTIFSNLTLSKQIFTINISNILRTIQYNNKSDILNNFLIELNKTYSEYSVKDKELFNVIIYTNIPSKLKESNILLDILKYFDLEIFEFKNYNFEYDTKIEDNIKYKFNCTKFLMIKYCSAAMDYEFVKTKALNRIYSFFGYLTYINRFNKDTWKWHINEITLDNKITDLQINALIGTDINFKIFDLETQYDILDTAIKMNKSKINLKNLQLNHTLLKSIFKSKNDKLFAQLKEYFCLYYISSSETVIENSFMKFWSLSERIIKDIHGNMKDNILVKYMKKLLEICNYPDKIIQRVNFIKYKRNNLVHENIHGEITQSDQAIAKILAENSILLLIHYFNKVDTIKDYSTHFNLNINN